MKKAQTDPLKIIIRVIILIIVLAIVLFTFRKYFGQEVTVINTTLANLSSATGGWF